MGKKILVINQLGMGDVIVTTPILKALRRKYPDDIISIMVRPDYEELVKGLPFIDSYILYRKQDGILLFLKTIKRIWRYDIALCFDFKYRSAVLPFFAGIPIRAGIKFKRGLFLTHSTDVFEDNKYQPDNFAEMLQKTVGIQLSDNLSTLYLPNPTKENSQNVDKLLSGNR